MTDHEITETDIKLDATLREICANDSAALLWLNQCRECIMAFDHWYDDDGNIPKEEIVRIMKYLTVDWGINQFYRKHSLLLSVVILNAISAWEFSNLNPECKFKAYDIYSELASTVCFILLGHEGMKQYIPCIRELTYKLYLEDEERDGT